ncbi:MAG: efflux RND transporter permease subunit, partial [Candidatus Obscuribacterales bacterium]|nr:efflux RND transporter permease subunit [Candidatus Obscuribacterales bacterium]
GEDQKELAEFAEVVKARISKVDGLVDIVVASQEGAPELRIKPDPMKLARLELTPAAIADQTRIALLGIPATRMKRGDKLIDVRVRLKDEIRFDPTKLAEIPIVGKNGNILPLAALAIVERVQGEREIHRENRQRYVSVEANIEGRDLGSVIMEVKKELKSIIVPVGFFLSVAGLYQSQQESFVQLFLVLILGALLVYLVLVAQFRSLKQPLAIFAAVPLSLLGVECALLYTNTPLNVSSFMGLIMLVGLIVKNGIILLEYSNRLQRRGMTADDALVRAGVVRLRPILMTTLCTLFGLLPLAIGLGAGAEIQQPLAITVIGGLTISTVITLIVVPVLNSLLAGRRSKLTDK